ncbi:hypothetical protein pb186bvf_008789 [Paramecium bursaria]
MADHLLSDQVIRSMEERRIRNKENHSQDAKIKQGQIDEMLKEINRTLNTIAQERNSWDKKNEEFLNEFRQAQNNLKNSQVKAEQEYQNLYNLKTELLDQLMVYMPSVGYRHKQQLATETTSDKIKRHRDKKQKEQSETKNLYGASEFQLSQAVKNTQLEPIQQEQSRFQENESLTVSQSYTPSQIKKQQPPRIVVQQIPEDQSQNQRVQKKKQASPMEYGNYDD